MIEHSEFDQIWIVVTPQNPLRKKDHSLTDDQRFHLVELAIQHYPRIKTSNIEFLLQKPNYTIDFKTHKNCIPC